MWQFTGDLQITLAMIFGGAAAALVLGLLAWLLLASKKAPDFTHTHRNKDTRGRDTKKKD